MILTFKKILIFLKNTLFTKKEYWHSSFDKVRRIGKIEKSISGKIQSKKTLTEKSELKIAVLFHLYYIDLWPEFQKYLKHITVPFDLYINLVEGSAPYPALIIIRNQIKRSYPASTVIISDNRGLDIGGTLNLLNIIIDKKKEYDLFLKIHTKKSFESTSKVFGKRWRRELLNSLMGSPRIVTGILILFKENPMLGMLGSKTWHIKAADNYYFAVGANESGIKDICTQFNLREDIASLEFIGGTMFWIDAKVILNKIRQLNLNNVINKLEVGYFRDSHESTLTHSMERVFGLIILDAKKEIVTI